MKALLAMIALAGVLCAAALALSAEEPHSHIGGPKGGRLLEKTEPHAEFYVETDNTVTITFYDEAFQPVPVTEQHVSVIAEADGTKTTLEFERKGDVLVSEGPLPDAHGLNLVVQFRQATGAKPLNFRFPFEDHLCDVCKRAEYACFCEH